MLKDSYPKVAIIILNWNGWKDTIECLESVYQNTYPNYDVIVVDNGSKDDSVRKIKEYCDGKIKVESKFFEYDPSNKPIYVLEYTREEAEKGGNFRKEKYFSKLPSDRKLRLILNEKNYGFAEGNNIGIRYALKALEPKYILLLNNDTVVDKNFLTELVKVAESDERIGIVGPKIYYYDYMGKNNIIWFGGGYICKWWVCVFYHADIGTEDVKTNDFPKDVAWITGAALMMNTKYFKELNKEYFFGHEDIELCINALHKGLRVVYVPSSKIWHKVGVSRKKAKITAEVYKGYFTFIKNNFSILLYIYQIIINIISIPIRIIKNRDLGLIYYIINSIKNFK